MSDDKRRGLSIGIIGHVDHGKSCLTAALTHMIEKEGKHIIVIGAAPTSGKSDFADTLEVMAKQQIEQLRQKIEELKVEEIFAPPLRQIERNVNLAHINSCNPNIRYMNSNFKKFGNNYKGRKKR